MPFLLESNQDIIDLLDLQLSRRDSELHHAPTVEAAVEHLATCNHETVLVGGEPDEEDWPRLFAVVPDGATVTLWSSHPGSRIPTPPPARDVATGLLLGLPPLRILLDTLVPVSLVDEVARTA